MKSLQQRINAIDEMLASGVSSNTQDGNTTVLRTREDLLAERERLVAQKASSSKPRRLFNRVRIG